MMSNRREGLLEAIGVTYQQLTQAVAEREMGIVGMTLQELRRLKGLLEESRQQERQRYLHVAEEGRSCLLSRDEDGETVIVQAWKGCETCEVTRFRTQKEAHDSLLQAGYVAMSMI